MFRFIELNRLPDILELNMDNLYKLENLRNTPILIGVIANKTDMRSRELIMELERAKREAGHNMMACFF